MFELFGKSEQRGERGKPRLVHANRHQLQFEPRSLDALIADDDRARTLWLASERLDLTAFYDEIEAVECGPGLTQVVLPSTA